MDGKGWTHLSFHPMALAPPSNFRGGASPQRQQQRPSDMPPSPHESHAFVQHTLAHHTRHLTPHRRTRMPSASAVRSSTAGSVNPRRLILQGSASAPTLQRGWPVTPPTGRPALSPPRPASRSKLPDVLDPSREPRVVPNLAYTNYMALATPMVQRWTRGARKPARASPPRMRTPAADYAAAADYYAAHEIWPKGHHAPGVQYHLRPLHRASTAVGSDRKPDSLEARGEVIFAARGLEDLVAQKPAEIVARPFSRLSTAQVRTPGTPGFGL